MTKTAKIIYFIVAVLAMVGLATATIAMAENRPLMSTVLFILAFAIIAGAFIVKARIASRTQQRHAREGA